MSVCEHPERVKACRRGELAARLLPKALGLACLVHGEGDAAAVGEFLRGLGPDERDALPVILAALVPVDRSPADLLGWVTWDEYGRPLPGPVRERTAPRTRRTAVDLEPCGTYAAYGRHKWRGEVIDEDCREAARAYWRTRQRAVRGRTAA